MVKDMNVTDKIREIRTAKGLTQTEVAKRYGTSPEFYHRLEKKENKLTIEQAEKIAGALGISLGELLGYENTGESKAVKELETRLEQSEKENEELKLQIEAYEPLIKLVNLLSANPERLEIFAEKVSSGKVDRADIEESFPDVKAEFEKPGKEAK